MVTIGKVDLTCEWINDPQGLFGLARSIVVARKNWKDLPIELKMKIVESLHGVDIARVSCVCTEISNMASDNDLWKKKFAELCGEPLTEEEDDNWKDRFAGIWRQYRRGGRKGRVSCQPWYEVIGFDAREWDRGSGSLSCVASCLRF